MAVLSIGCALAQVEFAWSVGAELTSAYLWRGQYNGGLSFQPDLSIGFEGEHTSLSVGAWGNVGVSDWKFSKGNTNPALDTYFNPELDLYLNFGFYGVHIGATHYYYFDGSKYFVGINDPGDNTTQTEVSLGYHFADEFNFGLYFDAYTMILGDDGYMEPGATLLTPATYKRAFSTYLELGYDIELPDGFKLKPALGVTPNLNGMYTDYENTWNTPKTLGITNLCLRFDKEWELGDHVTLGVFALGSVNFYNIDKDNLWLNTSGEDKVGSQQKLNGCIGASIWFE